MGEWLRTLYGSWDPTKIESDFYRPLTAAWFAARFALVGLNGVMSHALSLAAMIACAWLAGLFVRRETGSDRAAIFATGLYAIHPAFAYSQAVWLTNQMHLLASLVVLTSLLVWQRVRDRPAVAWWPLVVLQLVGFGIKEDLVMLAPLLVALTALRRLMRGDLPRPQWPVTITGLALPVACFGLRYAMLGRLGGYGPAPHAPQAWANFITGLLGVFRQVPARRPWQAEASAFSQAVLLAGAAGSLVRRREAHLLATGLVLALVFRRAVRLRREGRAISPRRAWRGARPHGRDRGHRVARAGGTRARRDGVGDRSRVSLIAAADAEHGRRFRALFAAHAPHRRHRARVVDRSSGNPGLAARQARRVPRASSRAASRRAHVRHVGVRPGRGRTRAEDRSGRPIARSSCWRRA